MNNDRVSEILSNFRSYRYAAKVGADEGFLDGPPTLYSERRMSPNRWDASRYNRIVNTVTGAVDDVLTDEQRTVIQRRYLDRNPLTLNQIADILNCDPSTITRRHKEALRKLGIALQPLENELEITPFEHMFNAKKLQENASS